MQRMGSLRWAFRFGDWIPTGEEWILATQCLQAEEKQRIGRFYFKKDAKSAMAGRLMLRKCICETLGMPYNEIKLSRTEKGKPLLQNAPKSGLQNFNFNVSHHGSYSVLAAEPVCQVGVDVMKIEHSRASKTVAEFLDAFRPKFTTQEMKFIEEPSDEWKQLSRFYRYWCLKESYVKTLGIGIGFDLERMDFHVKTSELSKNVVTMDTNLYVDGKLESDWVFEETLLDDLHPVVVALQGTEEQRQEALQQTPKFETLTFQDLVKGAIPLSEPDNAYWEAFNSKQERPGMRS